MKRCGLHKVELGRALRIARQIAGWTLGDVARALDVPVHMVSELENGLSTDEHLPRRALEWLDAKRVHIQNARSPLRIARQVTR